jgi:arylsulfatase A-like enzyme
MSLTHRLKNLFAIALWIVSPLCAASAAGAEAPARHPNVVVFLADDLGWRDLGYAGSTFYETPNIDALAKRGTVFTNAYAACPVCSPTRAALLTGRYPARTGITDWIGALQPSKAATRPMYSDRLLPAPYKTELALDEVTLGEAFKEAGYATFFAGKWHLGRKQFYPDKQGFDITLGAGNQGSPGPGGYFSPYKVPLSPGPQGEHLDLRLANETAKWIASTRSKDKPFLAYFSLYDVHTPLMAPAEAVKYFEAKRERLALKDEFGDEGATKVRLTQSHAIYAAMVKTMDDAVGIVMKQLEADQLLENTVIVFTSDNGGLSTREGSPTSNLPLRAGKGWAYEGGVRVPMLAVVPGVTRAGSTCDDRVISTDVFPTLLAMCGLAPRPKDHVDGVNVLPALRGGRLPERPLFWHYPHYGNQGGAPFSAIRLGDWKLIAFHDARQGSELYDLATDPAEQHNLAKQQPAKVTELRARLDAWKKEIGAVDATPHSATTKPAGSVPDGPDSEEK